jgi:predicted anti-sigma-YlaC factor YlaD
MTMRCANPIDASALADYWIAALKSADEALVEEHLLQCDACGERLREVIALAEGIRDLAREGSLRMVVSDAFLKRSEENGARIRQYAPPPGGSVECTVTAEDDLLIGRLAANLTSATRVDLCLCDGSGIEQHRLRDIPVHSAASGVIYQESITMAKALPTTKLIMRLVAFDEAGSERPVGEYVFNHTRTLPG